EQQWYGGLTVGGIERFVEPFAKRGRAGTSPPTLYESVVRAGGMGQRGPQGPIYLNVPLEHKLPDWTPPALSRAVPPPPPGGPRRRDGAARAEGADLPQRRARAYAARLDAARALARGAARALGAAAARLRRDGGRASAQCQESDHRDGDRRARPAGIFRACRA